MKKIYKILILLLLLTIIIGSSITVYLNHKKEQKEEQTEINKTKNKYKISRKNNKYTITSSDEKFNNKKITNIFYDDKNVYLYLEEDKQGSLLKYDTDKNIIIPIFENNISNIKSLGSNYIINNEVYNNKFKKIGTYPNINDNEILLPNLKYKFIKTNDSIIKKDLENDSEEEYIKNDIDNTYEIFLISNNSKTVLLKRISKENIDLVYLDNNEITQLNIKYNDDTKYSLLTDKYLLINNNKKEIFDIKTNEIVYELPTNSTYNNQYLMYKDEENKIIFKNYVTQEEKEIMTSIKTINKFICSNDGFSLVLHFDEDEHSFYIIYL